MNIYVGNLPYSLTEEELRELFVEYGDVESVKIITDRATGRSRGFGFVDMVNREEGEAAVQNLNEKSVKNRNLVVNEARPRRHDNRVRRR